MDMQLELSIVNILNDGSFTIRKWAYVLFNGEKNYLGQPEQLIIMPGEHHKIQEFAPDILHLFQVNWTPQMIQAHQDNVETIETAQFNLEG